MVKIDNISNSLMSNPLTHIVLVLFLLLIILGVIRIFSPQFSLGAKVGGHFGSLSGSVNVEGFEGQEEGNTMPSTEMGDMADMGGMGASNANEEDDSMESFQNYY